MSTSTTPLSIATSIFAIQDVFLVASKATVDRAHNPMDALTASVQIRHTVEPGGLWQSRTAADDNAQLLIMRRYVDTGFRIMGAGAPEEAEQPNPIAEIELTFAADYLVTTGEKPEEEVVVAFGENVLFHIWPYWREYIQSSLSRMRLPPIILPMFRRNRPQERASGSTPEDESTGPTVGTASPQRS